MRFWAGEVDLQGKDAIDHVWPPFQRLIDGTPDDSPCFTMAMRYWLPTRWENWGGRVTLLGDAAHPTLPC
jgi:2-polyprenyl-6-methoxyphenol hydroxylase-like FAD-dependent oxidoreductase